MAIEIYVIILGLGVFSLYLIAPHVARSFLKYRGKRVVTCPETRKAVGIQVDALHAASTAVVGSPDLRLKSCTRWPERQDCGQECLLQVELSPQDCLLRNILATWYEGKHCVSCGKKFGEIHLLDHKPAFLTPDGKQLEWNDLAPENVPDTLATHFPVCWDCYIVETFCRENPDMMVDRSRISAGIHQQSAR